MIRGVIGVLAAVALWQAAVWLTGLPPYLLPGPAKVAQTLAASRAEIAQAALFTAAETLVGLVLGAGLGMPSPAPRTSPTSVSAAVNSAACAISAREAASVCATFAGPGSR